MPTLLRGPLIGPMTQFVPHPMTATFRALARHHADRAAVLEPYVGGRLDRAWQRVRNFAVPRLGSSPRGSLLPSGLRDAAVESSLLAHIYACMASEAATNQIAADIIPYDDLADFDRCKRKFGGNPSGVSLLVWKWKKILDARGRATEVTEPALVELGQLVDDRNALIHYSLMDEATRLIFDRPHPPTPPACSWSGPRTRSRRA